MKKIPQGLITLNHVALQVHQLEACERFYVELIGMKIDWRPDPDNLYLTSGHDNLALHRSHHAFSEKSTQHLDHIGFAIASREAVDHWHDYLRQEGVVIQKAPKDHRDGTRSFYCKDPDGNTVQFIYYPPPNPLSE